MLEEAPGDVVVQLYEVRHLVTLRADGCTRSLAEPARAVLRRSARAACTG